MIGQTIAHYKILEKLGEGGMGIVYKARDTNLDRLVALKFLPQHLTENSAEKARFLQEAKAASSLNHPNVCTIHGIEEHEGLQFIEMEFIEGVTLREKLPVEKISEAINYAIQIADALQEAHAKGIVHRDIKADNIMVNAKNQIKVMDFGLAKLKGSLKLTRTSSTVGTLAYMAPEQIQGGDVDQRSDIFSFGVVLFELLTGKLPFRGDHEAAIMYSILNEEPEPVVRHRPELSPEIIHILDRSLDKDPADRYQSAQDMLIDLRRQQKQSTKLSRASLMSMPVPASEEMRDAEIPSGTSRQSGSKKLILIGGSIVLLVVAAALGKLFLGDLFVARTEPFQTIKITRLTTSGKAAIAAISPDGKYVVHVVQNGEQQSLWVRQVATTSNVMIVPAADASYIGITFSRDGNYLYYVVIDDANTNGALYALPVLGGTPRKILSDIATTICFSPDGKQIAFVRQIHAGGEEALMVANADGTEERKITVRKGDDFFIAGAGSAPSWSPDGKLIAISAASNKGVQHVNIMAFAVADGSEKPLSLENWSPGHVVWCPDGKGLTFVAARGSVTNSQIWYLRYPEGTVRGITNDLSDYLRTSFGMTDDASTLVSTSFEITSNIWVLPKTSLRDNPWDVHQAAQITSGAATYDGLSGLAWTSDHKVIFSSAPSGVEGLWVIDPDGSEQRQLTQGRYKESSPSVSPDGKSIAYVSQRDTTPHIWRMDVDGSNRSRLTSSEDYSPSITPDGKWVIYSGWATGKTLIYKVPISGGDTVNLSQNPATRVAISPDGKLLVCRYFDQRVRKWGFAVTTGDGASLQRFFTLPNSVNDGTMGWYPDGSLLTFVDTKNGVSNVWGMPPGGGEAKQLTNFTSELIFSYAWSRDGTYLALARGHVTSDVVLITDVK